MPTLKYRLIFLRILLGALALVAATVNAEELRYQFWSVGATTSGRPDLLKGLPQISARALVKGPEGLLWVGTENGVARFDGLDFDVFNSRNTAELTSSWIEALHVDQQNRVWVSTADGVVIVEEQQFRRLSSAEDGLRFTSITETTDGTVWLGGESLWQSADAGIAPAGFYAGAILDLQAVDDTLWIAGGDGSLYRYSSGEVQAVDNSQFGTKAILSLDRWRDYVVVNVGSALYLVSSKPNGSSLQRIEAPDGRRIAALATSADQFLAVAGSGELFELHHDSSDWQRLDIPTPVPVDRSAIATLLDTDGRLWVGTVSAGLHMYWPSGVRREAKDSALGSTLVWSFFVADTVYAATDLGLFKRLDQDNWLLVVANEDIDNAIAYSYFQDETGQYVGTRTGLYWRPDESSPFSKIDFFSNWQINSIFREHDRRWFATNQGVFYQGIDDPEPVAIDGVQGLSVRSLYRDQNGTGWIATESGLYRKDGDVVRRADHPLLKTAFSTALISLGDDMFALTTYGEGLFVRSADGVWTQFDRDDGLAFQDFFSLTVAGEWLWATAGSGVMRFDLAELKEGRARTDVVLRDDGVFPERNRLRCCNGAGLRRSVAFEDRLFLPTLQGVLTVQLDHPLQPAAQPVVTGVWQGSQRRSFEATLVLPTDQRDIEVSFASPHFSGEDIPEFRYRLVPTHDDWVYPGDRKVAYFTNIDAGASQFELQSRVGVSDWMSAHPLPIYVQPLVWETWYFRTLVAGLALLGFWWLLRLRTSQLQARAEALEQLVTARTADVQAANQVAEDTARDSQRLIREANAPIVTIDENGAILDWNLAAKRLTGYALEEIQGQRIAEVLTDATPAMDPQGLFVRLRSGRSVSALRLSFSNRDGRLVTLLLGGTLLPAFRNAPERVVLVGQDLTEYLEREQQLIQASKMSTLGEMATGVAHELNQPLNVIRLALSNITRIVERKPEKIATVPEKLQRINDQVERAAKIIDHLRLFGRRSSTPGELEHTRFNPHAAVDGAVGLFREQLVLENIELLTDYVEGDLLIDGDPLLLEQVIMNLFSNARDAIKQHTSFGGERWIKVTTQQSADVISIAVEDTGGGAPESTLKSMFEPFYTTKEPGKGTGLGLSISYSSIRGMSGEISASNTDKGLRVLIQLPLVALESA